MLPLVNLARLLCFLLPLGLALGCGKEPTLQGGGRADRGTETPRSASTASTGAAGLEQRRAALLTRIRAADPQQATIERALINERNELGLVLSRQANLDDIPKLMKPLLADLDEAFPGESHTIVAYTPTNPPRRIGTGRLNARTREMTYTRESP